MHEISSFKIKDMAPSKIIRYKPSRRIDSLTIYSLICDRIIIILQTVVIIVDTVIGQVILLFVKVLLCLFSFLLTELQCSYSCAYNYK